MPCVTLPKAWTKLYSNMGSANGIDRQPLKRALAASLLAWARQPFMKVSMISPLVYCFLALVLSTVIGSGAVESANRHVVGVRVKQAGMRWTATGVAGVLALRALLRSTRWEAWWQAQPPPLPLAA